MLRLEVPTEQRNEDVRVALVLESAKVERHESVAAKPIWEKFEEIVATLTPEDLANLPSDGAENHDAYICGKRQASE
jgi:hypothetical protein